MSSSSTSIGLVITIAAIFIFVGVLLPYVRSDMGLSASDMSTGNIEQDMRDNMGSEAAISIWTVIGSVLSMFLWTFGALPFWLEMIFTIMRVTLYMGIGAIIRGV